MMKQGSIRTVCLTERDTTILEYLHRYRCLSVDQIRRICFPSKQTVNRRLRYLQEAGYLSIHSIPGLGDRTVRLNRRGAEYLEALDPDLPTISIPRTSPKDHYFIRHLLALNEFRITLERDCRNEEVLLSRFLADYDGGQSAGGAVRKALRSETCLNGEVIGHTPDGAFILSKGDLRGLFFVEIDRGTEVIGRADRGVGKICHFYLSLLSTGAWKRYLQTLEEHSAPSAFRLLLYTTSSKRLENIRHKSRSWTDFPQKAKRFLWLSSLDQVVDGFLRRPHFHSLDPDDPTEYAILPKKGR